MPPRSVLSPDWVYIQRVKRKRELEKKAKAAGKVPNSLGNPLYHPNHAVLPISGVPGPGGLPAWLAIQPDPDFFSSFVEEIDPPTTASSIAAHPAAIAVAAAADNAPAQLPGSFPLPAEFPDPPIPVALDNLSIPENLNDLMASMNAQMNALYNSSGAGHSATHPATPTPATHKASNTDTSPQAARNQGTQTGDLEKESWRSMAARAAYKFHLVASGQDPDPHAMARVVCIAVFVSIIFCVEFMYSLYMLATTDDAKMMVETLCCLLLFLAFGVLWFEHACYMA